MAIVMHPGVGHADIAMLGIPLVDMRSDSKVPFQSHPKKGTGRFLRVFCKIGFSAG